VHGMPYINVFVELRRIGFFLVVWFNFRPSSLPLRQNPLLLHLS